MSASMDRDLSGRDGVYHVAVQRTGKRASKLNADSRGGLQPAAIRTPAGVQGI